MKSIMQTKKECYLCRMTANVIGYDGQLTDRGLEEHHVISGTANRAKSERHGLKVYLCKMHHTAGKDAVHMNRSVELCLKREAQTIFERTHTRKEWLEEFGKSWL